MSSARKPRAQYWYNLALGRVGITMSATANVWEGKIGVRVYMVHRHVGDAALQQLLESREEIEHEIGPKPSWNPNPEATDKTIALHREEDFARRDEWPEHVAWMVETIAKFRRTFGPRVKQLDLDGDDGVDDPPVEA